MPVHGDFYEAQLLVAGGAVTGLLDVDTTGCVGAALSGLGPAGAGVAFADGDGSRADDVRPISVDSADPGNPAPADLSPESADSPLESVDDSIGSPVGSPDDTPAGTAPTPPRTPRATTDPRPARAPRNPWVREARALTHHPIA
ncbi:hypothetical protein [Pseudonocardia acidicola]|uniref:Uncharacterized protein n=1 Tax=Pseudonocardia acidicola TaxID=2724939 RepID=A0ABX1SEC5_9PSEU|nr:hypothetical protein [Pseudonocardia acidicola]